MEGMDKDRIKYHHSVINDYVSGKTKLQGQHPEEVEKAIDTFFHAGKMLVDNPEIEFIPQEYVTQLLETLAKYPQYNELTLGLIGIINNGETT